MYNILRKKPKCLCNFAKRLNCGGVLKYLTIKPHLQCTYWWQHTMHEQELIRLVIKSLRTVEVTKVSTQRK